MTNPAVPILAEKYASLLSESKRLRAELRAVEYSLEHVKVTLLLFDPEYPVFGLKPSNGNKDTRKPQTDRNRVSLDMLRTTAAPMTSREIAIAVLRTEGNENPTIRALDSVSVGVHQFLKR